MSSLGIADHNDGNDVDVDEVQSLAEYPRYGTQIKQLLAGTAPRTWRLFREALSDVNCRHIIDEIAADPTAYLPPFLFEVGILLLQRQLFDTFYRFFNMLAVPLQPQQAQALFGAALVEADVSLNVVAVLEFKYHAFTATAQADELALYTHLKTFLLRQRSNDVLAYLFDLSPHWQGWKGIFGEIIDWAALAHSFPVAAFQPVRDTFKVPSNEVIDSKVALLRSKQLGGERFPTRTDTHSPFLTDPRFVFSAKLR
jgi:hypothetical protein